MTIPSLELLLVHALNQYCAYSVRSDSKLRRFACPFWVRRLDRTTHQDLNTIVAFLGRGCMLSTLLMPDSWLYSDHVDIDDDDSLVNGSHALSYQIQEHISRHF